MRIPVESTQTHAQTHTHSQSLVGLTSVIFFWQGVDDDEGDDIDVFLFSKCFTVAPRNAAAAAAAVGGPEIA